MGRNGEALAAFAAGFLLCAVIIYPWQPPSRVELLEEVAEDIEDDVPEVQTEVEREEPAGHVLYVSMRKARPQDDYIAIARIEIGYEGQILASLWDSGTGFYTHHFNEAMTEDEVVEAVRRVASERAKK